MKNFNPEHVKWAQKVIDEITPEAIALKKDFYPLQSEIKDHPKFLFLGLNPGGGFTYESQAEKWNFKTEANGSKRKVLTPEILLNGNPFFGEESEKWKYMKGLKKIDAFSSALDEGDYVLANYYYISTFDFKETNQHKTALEKCKKFTSELIQLLQPEVIVILGTRNGLDILDDFSNKKTLLFGCRQRLLLSADFHGIKTLAIPHPSRMMLNNRELSALNANISELLENKPLTAFSNIKPISISAFDFAILEAKLKDSGVDKNFEKSSNGKYADMILENGTNRMLVRINISDKTLNFRDADAKSSGSDDRFYTNISNSENLINSIPNLSTTKTNSWFMQKYFSAYPFESLDELYKQIVADISRFNHSFNK